MLNTKNKQSKVEFVIRTIINKETFESKFYVDCYINNKFSVSKEFSSLVECQRKIFKIKTRM